MVGTVHHSSSGATPPRLPFARVFVAIGGIYVVQSLVSGLTFQAVPAVLRANGLPLDQIGLVSLALLPWALKFLWAPWIEGYRHGSAHGRSRRIVIAGECMIVVALLGAAVLGPARIAPLMAVLGFAALVSATVDIACDGFAVEQLPPGRRGWGNTAQVGGSYLGFMLGGGAYLWAVSQLGFTPATIGLAMSLLLLAIPFALIAREPRQLLQASRHRPSLRYALRRREVQLGLILVVLCWLGPRLSAALVSSFLIDRGVGLDLLGALNGAASIAAGLAGTAMGGAVVQMLGPRWAVVAAVSLQATALLVLVAVSSAEQVPLPALVGATVGLTASMAVGFVAIYALLMGASSLRQAGVDFTLFQCAEAMVAALAGASGGLLAEALGYGHVFALSAALATMGAAAAALLGKQIATPAEEAEPCPISAPSS